LLSLDLASELNNKDMYNLLLMKTKIHIEVPLVKQEM